MGFVFKGSGFSVEGSGFRVQGFRAFGPEGLGFKQGFLVAGTS